MSLGIDEVYLGSDGEDGCRQALLHEPDIILSDVRMPRMDGIEMLERIRKNRPDTIFIFMSGYSDKEYLKAAIRLQAVSYVEKPLDRDEVAAAVREAVLRRRRIDEGRRAENVSDTVSASHLALCLTMPYQATAESVRDLSREYCRKYGTEEMFRSACTLMLQMDERDELSPDFLTDLSRMFHDRIRTNHMHMICAERRTNLFVFHIFRKESFSNRTVRAEAEQLSGLLPSDKNWYITAGRIVSGINSLYDSYSSAVILLQNSFFYSPRTILISDHDLSDSPVTDSIDELADSLRQALKDADRSKIEALEAQLFAHLDRNKSILKRTVQALYYRIASTILEEARRRQLPGAGIIEKADATTNSLYQCFSLEELHRLLTDMTDRYLSAIENYVPENSSVYLIKSYIHEHYRDPMLSTKEISQAASLSASYACTVFKNETGQTLNRYLTEYRMERAKELLDDPRNNISETAARVGYNDSNYFGKAFKKYSGFSPSEYRDRRTGQ